MNLPDATPTPPMCPPQDGGETAELQEALADLIEAFTTGECYETKNPYVRPYVVRGLRALGRSAGISTFGGDWMDVLGKFRRKETS